MLKFANEVAKITWNCLSVAGLTFHTSTSQLKLWVLKPIGFHRWWELHLIFNHMTANICPQREFNSFYQQPSYSRSGDVYQAIPKLDTTSIFSRKTPCNDGGFIHNFKASSRVWFFPQTQERQKPVKVTSITYINRSPWMRKIRTIPQQTRFRFPIPRNRSNFSRSKW